MHVHLEARVDIFDIVYLFEELLNKLEVLLCHLLVLSQINPRISRLVIEADPQTLYFHRNRVARCR
jgi:hypothetical protein